MTIKKFTGIILILTGILVIPMGYSSIGTALMLILGCKLVDWI